MDEIEDCLCAQKNLSDLVNVGQTADSKQVRYSYIPYIVVTVRFHTIVLFKKQPQNKPWSHCASDTTSFFHKAHFQTTFSFLGPALLILGIFIHIIWLKMVILGQKGQALDTIYIFHPLKGHIYASIYTSIFFRSIPVFLNQRRQLLEFSGMYFGQK